MEEKNKKQDLQPTLIGGMVGLLIGSAGELFAEPYPETVYGPPPVEDDVTGGVVVTMEGTYDDGDMSFSEAFAAARAEQGPGGVFEWHGNLYSTYYENEWSSMSAEEHDAYLDWALSGGHGSDGPENENDDVIGTVYGPPPVDDDTGLESEYETLYGCPSYDDGETDDIVDIDNDDVMGTVYGPPPVDDDPMSGEVFGTPMFEDGSVGDGVDSF